MSSFQSQDASNDIPTAPSTSGSLILQNEMLCDNLADTSVACKRLGVLGGSVHQQAPLATCYLQGVADGGSDGPTDFQFVSGYKPVGQTHPNQMFPKVECATKEPEKAGIKCKWPGCRSKATFKRNYELQRHMKKHSREQTFDCPAVNCRYRGAKGFYRADKLKDHVNAAHDDETLFTCPVIGCLSALNSLPRGLLSIHIRNHINGACKPYWSYFAALELKSEIRACPVGKCQAKLEIYKLGGHIHQHSEEDRVTHQATITSAGFNAINGHSICPVCEFQSSSLQDLHDHIDAVHLVLDPEHFSEWKMTISKSISGPLLPWKGCDIVRAPNNPICPVCNNTTPPGLHATHHLDLLRDSKELHRYREQILKLYPEFGSHPVFDDVMPTVHRKPERAW